MSFVNQYDAAHRSAVISDGSFTGTLGVTGSDRHSFLQALLTNDMTAVAKGRGTYAAFLTPQGRMISDMRVIETGDQILLDVERSVAEPLAQRFERLIFSEDVQVKDLSGKVDVIGMHGPAASDAIERSTGISVAELESQYSNLTIRPASPFTGPLTVVRDDTLGVPGFYIYVAARDTTFLREQLVRTGALTASSDTLETLRIEAGRPRFGVDMSTETIPLEAGIEDRAISFTKGCYVGQEVIIRVMHRGHGRVARRLVRLVIPGGPVPSRGDKVFAADQQVGEVTSAAESPRAGGPMAMAYVHRDYAGGQAELTVNGSQARVYQAGN
jgi:folate-binding protein YgfZ